MIRNQLTVFRAAALAACLTLSSASGCKSQQTAFYNPFQLAPDKVPPPSTRTLLPGQAAPYYPGDPLPSMQSAARQPAPSVAAANPTAVAAKSAAPVAQPSAAPSGRPTALASNESTVAIPSDGDSLRFALPKAAPANVVAAAPQVQQPTTQLAAATQMQPQQASFASFDQAAPLNAAGPASPGWRSPQVARQPATQAPAPTLALGPPPTGPQFASTQAPVPFAPQTIAVPASSMPVTLRAVSSPPVEQVASPTPRIRMPASDAQPTAVVQSGPVQQAAYYYSPSVGQPVAMQPMPGTVVQTVQVTPLAANTYSPTVAATNPSDGFRPRGSMR